MTFKLSVPSAVPCESSAERRLCYTSNVRNALSFRKRCALATNFRAAFELIPKLRSRPSMTAYKFSGQALQKQVVASFPQRNPNPINHTVRWLLLVPVMFAASAGSFAFLTLIWNLVSNFNIVAQTDFISLGLANFGINALSAALGVAAGSALLPSSRAIGALVAAAISVFIALALLAWALIGNSPLSMALGWHVLSTVGWLIGATVAAISIRSNAKGTSVPAT